MRGRTHEAKRRSGRVYTQQTTNEPFIHERPENPPKACYRLNTQEQDGRKNKREKKNGKEKTNPTSGAAYVMVPTKALDVMPSFISMQSPKSMILTMGAGDVSSNIQLASFRSRCWGRRVSVLIFGFYTFICVLEREREFSRGMTLQEPAQ